MLIKTMVYMFISASSPEGDGSYNYLFETGVAGKKYHVAISTNDPIDAESMIYYPVKFIADCHDQSYYPHSDGLQRQFICNAEYLHVNGKTYKNVREK